MSNSVDLYTMGNMEKATVITATSEATGFPKENLLDNNPDTRWKATSTANQTIDFDLGEAKEVSGYYMFVHNYLLAETATISFYHSDDDSTYTFISGSTALTDPTGPHRIRLITPATHRYWRIGISSVVVIPEISMVAMHVSHGISVYHQRPAKDTDQFMNRVTKSASGRTFVSGASRANVKILPRDWILGQTDFTALQDSFTDSFGQRYPLVMVEADGTKRLVRFNKDKLNQNEIAYQLYRPKVEFVEVPYIEDGETF